MFEVIEHTADIGFRAWAKSPAELFETAAEALVSIAMELEPVAAAEAYPVEAAGADYESLLVNWLSEVLYLVDGRRLALRRFQVNEIGPELVSGQAWGETWNPERHRAKLIVKGVTYHQLQVVESAEGWHAQVILDI